MSETATHDNDAVLRGMIKSIGEPAVYGTNGFTKATCVLDTGGKYPQMIEVSFFKKGCDALKELSIGDVVQIRVHINGREYNGKYYTQLVAYSVDVVARRREVQSRPVPETHIQYKPSPHDAAPADDDSIPF